MLKLMCAAAALGSAAITECQKEPKANLLDKIKAYFSNL